MSDKEEPTRDKVTVSLEGLGPFDLTGELWCARCWSWQPHRVVIRQRRLPRYIRIARGRGVVRVAQLLKRVRVVVCGRCGLHKSETAVE